MPSQLIYRVKREVEHGYTIDRLWIAEYGEHETAKRLAGCVNNADGYGSGPGRDGGEAATKMSRVFAQLVADGYATFFDWSHGGDRSFHMRHQVYENPDAARPAYCEPRIEFPSQIDGAKWALAFLDKLGKRIERTSARERTKAATDGYKYSPRTVSTRTFEQVQDVTAALDAIGAVRVKRWTAAQDGWYSPPSYWVRDDGAPAQAAQKKEAA